MAKHVGMIVGLALALAAPPAMAQSLGERLLRGGAIAAQGLFLTTATEVELGKRTAAQVLAKMPAVQDPALQAYVAAVGAKVAAKAERRDVPYTFTVVDDRAVNAFSLAGGFVFITTGCLRAMQNEAQLAGVLGHEVGHVAHKDAVKAIRQALVASGVATTIAGNTPGQLEVAAINMGATLVLRGYGRRAEYAADLAGADYAARSGYDARQLETFLGILARVSGNAPTWLMPLADHPRSDDRIKRLETYIAQHHLPAGAVEQAAFDRNVKPALARLGGGAGR
ncbi:MAG: peptidase Ste24p [Cyanobacteria bacterium RYN_339]|nr:peptidase Ste24p [Cyanobacteria bacterium RYN_339]